jgi:hypothetical protein
MLPGGGRVREATRYPWLPQRQREGVVSTMGLFVLRTELAEHFDQGVDHLHGGVELDFVDADPSFVAAELVLFGCGEVAVRAVGDGDVHEGLDGAALLQFQADLGKHFKRHGGHGQAADAVGLHDDIERGRHVR